jgi:nicotinate-nucleotide adenylyltransferase
VPKAEKIGIIGGTFDPIHCGHLNIARLMGEKFNLERIIFMPALAPPHKDSAEISAFPHRYAMVEQAIKTENMFCASTLEAQRQGRSYTVDTLRQLRDLHPHAALYFLMGMDSFAKLDSWKEYHKLFEYSNIVVAQRPGTLTYARREDLPVALRQLFCYDAARNSFTYTDNTKKAVTPDSTNYGGLYFLREACMDISSTEIRCRVQHNQPLDGMVPQAVQNYIAQHGLYKELTSSRQVQGNIS